MSSRAAKSERNSPLLELPNELLWEVASSLESFKDLNSLLRTTRFFHTLFRSYLYRRAVAVEDSVRKDIVLWVLSEYRLDLLTLLLDNGLSVHQKLGWDSKQLLQWVCRNRFDKELSVPLAKLLIERGASIRQKDPVDSSTLLHVAASNCNYGLATLLLTNGADVDATGKKNGRATPLHFAVQEPDQDPSMIDLLIAHGAAVDARNCYEDTPLLLASRYYNARLLPVLLRHGADARAYNTQGATPLHLVCGFSGGDHEAAKLLVEHGADVNAVDVFGLTPLHWFFDAPRPKELRKVEFLLEKGADINALSRDGRSPLKEAFNDFRRCMNWGLEYGDGAVAVIRLLIANGADVSVLNKKERAEAIFMGIQINK
jgi:ankyrin repeat protein